MMRSNESRVPDSKVSVENLSPFNDVLRGGFGLVHDGEPISIVWAHSAKNRSDFDYHAVEYLEDIMRESPSIKPYRTKD
jgi:hypothetical protein